MKQITALEAVAAIEAGTLTSETLVRGYLERIAERDGVVRFAGDRGGYGNVVIIDHGDGLETRYAHCATLTVQAGDKVPEGAVVGTVGSTGRSTGPHLHFEVRQDGLPTNPTNFVKENR